MAVAEEKSTAGRLADVVAVLTLIVVLLLIHHGALHNGWLYDDPQLLLHALRVPSLDTLFVASQYRLLATHTFTPLLPISFKLDLALGGLNSAFAYGHQLLLLLAATLLLFVLLRQFVHRIYAFAASLLFGVSWPAIYAVRTLMIRHYLEGLVFALAALALFARSRDDERVSSRWPTATDLLVAVLYLVAMLEKELYVPLPFFLFFIGLAAFQPPRVVIRRLVPSAIAALLFAIWRTVMLGSVGGYENGVDAAALVRLPWTAWQQLRGGDRVDGTLLLLTLLALLPFALRQHRAVRICFVIGALLAALLPVAPLAAAFEWRFVFALAAIVAALFALAFDRAFQRQPVGQIIALFIAAFFAARAPRLVAMYDRLNEPPAAEARYIWTAPATAPLLVATSTPWTLSGLQELRMHFRHEASPSYAGSEDALLFTPTAAAVAWNESLRRIAPLHDERLIAAEKAQRSAAIDVTVVISRRNDTLDWTLASRRASQFQWLTLPALAVYPVPPHGRRRIPESRERQHLRIRAIAADGRWNATPELPLPLEGETLRWRTP